jgi:hypothetical protein
LRLFIVQAYGLWQGICLSTDGNTIKELKEDFALGGFSMERFYAAEAAMVLRVWTFSLAK